MHMGVKKKSATAAYTRKLLATVGKKRPLDILAGTPLKLKRAIHGLSERRLRKAPARGKWSIAQIVAHLCDGEMVLAYRFRKIIAEPGCEIQAYDQNAWAKRLRYDLSDTGERLALFSFLRKSNATLLGSLKPREWKLAGIHAERGRETISRLALLYAGHDLNHLKQVEKIAKSGERRARGE
jgi:hypothetical protein